MFYDWNSSTCMTIYQRSLAVAQTYQVISGLLWWAEYPEKKSSVRLGGPRDLTRAVLVINHWTNQDTFFLFCYIFGQQAYLEIIRGLYTVLNLFRCWICNTGNSYLFITKHVFCICRAVNANVTMVNEVGVDPGIDHMLAMQCFDEVKHAGGKVFIIHCLSDIQL